MGNDKKVTASLPLDGQKALEKPKARRKTKRGNDLDGATWLRYSISVWDDIKKSPDEIQSGHPAMFPKMLVRRLIQAFLVESQKVVLDPFVGSGSTMLGALEENKQGIGMDTSEEYIALAKRRCQNQQNQGLLWKDPSPRREPELWLCDARDLLSYIEPNSVDLCITSPPYWDILSQKRTADYKAVRDYGNHRNDLGTISDYKQFLGELKKVFAPVFVSLKPSCYCIVIVMDLRKGNRFYPFHSDVASFMRSIGYAYDDVIIWNRKSEYNNLRPLGYPAVFRVNKVHEFVLVFKTPAPKEKSRLDSALMALMETSDGEYRTASEQS